MADASLNLELPDAAATDALGVALAQALLRVAGPGRVLYLHGDLGAGKTTCARSLLRALGVDSTIRSPTYTLVESYSAAGMTCVHVDLYRLGSALEVHDLGLTDCLEGNSVLLVEWPEHGVGALPAADLHVNLSYHHAARRAGVTAASTAGATWQSMLRDDSSLTRYLSNSA